MLCRFSSAVHRPTHVPQAPSREKLSAMVRWYDGRLSSVSRLVIIATRATSDSGDCATSQSAPPRAAKFLPSSQGT